MTESCCISLKSSETSLRAPACMSLSAFLLVPSSVPTITVQMQHSCHPRISRNSLGMGLRMSGKGCSENLPCSHADSPRHHQCGVQRLHLPSSHTRHNTAAGFRTERFQQVFPGQHLWQDCCIRARRFFNVQPKN